MLRKQKFRCLLHLWTDASDLHDMRDYYLRHSSLSLVVFQAFSNRFNTRLKSKHINVKEMTTVLHALQTWLPHFARSNLTIYDNNAAVVVDINKSFMREGAMMPLRRIALLTAAHDILLHAQWISTTENRLADLLSRAKFSIIANEFPQLAKLQPTNASRQAHDTVRSPLIAQQSGTSGEAWQRSQEMSMTQLSEAMQCSASESSGTNTRSRSHA